jgi:tRNA pseudouridine55 synthase
MIRVAFEKFTGDQQQRPPAHSAIKKDGEPMYIKAREGTAPEMEARSIRIIDLEITHIALPEVHFRVACSKGTYIRSLAHDIGQELGCGAWLSSLVRTRIGSFHVQDAMQLETFLATVNLPQ